MNKIEINRRISEGLKKRYALDNTVKKQLTRDNLRKLYWIEKKSLGDIAKQYKCSRAHLFRLFEFHSLPVRSKSKARILAAKRGKLFYPYYEKNEKFFEEWSFEMAYMLGLIYADGCVNRYNLNVASKDKDFLDQIRNLIGSSKPLFKVKGQNLYFLDICSIKIVEDLTKLGVVPRKSLIIKFPNIPKTYISHFIRGYFDGDGYISKESKGNSWRVGFTTGSNNFIHSLKNKLEELSGVSKQKIYAHKTANAYAIYYIRRSDIEKLYEYFYDEYTKNNRLYLPRKFLKFQEATNSYKNWNFKQIKCSKIRISRKDRKEVKNETNS